MLMKEISIVIRVIAAEGFEGGPTGFPPLPLWRRRRSSTAASAGQAGLPHCSPSCSLPL